jgi:hypothetical protein
MNCVRPKSAVVVNLFPESSDFDWIAAVQSDACDLPRDGEFDFVYSNSLIEHLGGHARRCDFASVVNPPRERSPKRWRVFSSVDLSRPSFRMMLCVPDAWSPAVVRDKPDQSLGGGP